MGTNVFDIFVDTFSQKLMHIAHWIRLAFKVGYAMAETCLITYLRLLEASVDFDVIKKRTDYALLLYDCSITKNMFLSKK